MNHSNNKKSNKNGTKKPNPMALRALKHIEDIKAEEERIKLLQEEEDRKFREEEEKKAAITKAIEDEKIRKLEAKKAKIAAKKEAGTYKSKSQKMKEKKLDERRSRLISTTNIIESKNDISYEDKIVDNNLQIQFRSPIICIMGHVDTGKTKIMDNIRNTNIQEGEVAGITQQIGATFIPNINIIKKINKNILIPGLLMIDTPGHESFSNLRKRGSSFADLVILVIDIHHGLEKQTIESLNILKETNTQFVIALNKIDRLYGWNSINNFMICNSLENNKEICKHEFENKLDNIKGQLKEQGINSELFWLNNSIEDTVSICPLSAITGEGIPDLLNLIVTISETYLIQQITISEKLNCVVMEKTVSDGIGVTVDALLINGTLNKGDYISIVTNNGTIKTQIRNLLTPPPCCESTYTTKYNNNNSLTGAIGFKLVANNLDNVILGSDIVINNDPDQNINDEDLHFSSNIYPQFKFEETGVLIYASSEGSLESLINYLQNKCKVSIGGSYIGKVMKKHITKMNISNKTNYKENNAILAFDVNIDDDVYEFANNNNITILTDGTIYRLFDQYNNFRLSCINERKNKYKDLVVYPCILNILQNNIFKRKGPFIFGVKVIKGSLHINTPIIIPGKKLILGRVVSIQKNHEDITIAHKDSEVSIKIDDNVDNNYTYGRQFNYTDPLVSHITRNSVDIMKEHFRDEITNSKGGLNETGNLIKEILKMIS
jgi:translation initiation factor 5B